MKSLTKKQMKTFDFIKSFKKENDIFPTYEEIGKGLNIKTSSAFLSVKRLESKGYIKRSRLTRSIKILS